MKSYVMTVLLGCAVLSARAQSRDVNEKIWRVETHLSGWVRLTDSDNWSLQDRMKFYGVKGLSIAVIHHYKLDWAKGYGWADEGERRPVTTKTLFQAGSVSKSLNGVGVMLLVQRHQLDIDQDVNDYLKSWKFPYDTVSKGRKITIGNLLSHTGGLSVHGFPGYKRGDTFPTIYQVLDGKKPANTPAVRSMETPGKSFIYSGGGTTISQLIVTDITAMPYDRFMWQNVLKPMGMTNSSYAQPPLASADRATGYLAGGKEVPGKYNIYPEQAAAGLWTTPSDLAKYIIESQLSLAGKSAKVLTQASTKIRLSPYIDSILGNGNQQGLGVFLFQRGKYRYFNHSGSDHGFLTLYYGCFENGDGVVVMINNDVNMKLIQELINSVARVYQWEGFYNPEKRHFVQLSTDTAAHYEGVYYGQNDTVTITQNKGKLYYSASFMLTDHRQLMYFTSPADFITYEEGFACYFKNDRLVIKEGPIAGEFTRKQ